MTLDEIIDLAGHRDVPAWVLKLVQDAIQSQRKPLTEDEIDRAWRSVDYKISYDNFRIEVARAIERAHGIGNEE